MFASGALRKNDTWLWCGIPGFCLVVLVVFASVPSLMRSREAAEEARQGHFSADRMNIEP